jgi:hypothetical protein
MPAATATKSSARARSPKKLVGPPRPTLLQRLDQEIASSSEGGFSLGRWLAGLNGDELQQIEDAARRYRGDIFSFVCADPLKVAAMALSIQAAEGISCFDDGNCPTQALFNQNIVLETLVQAERLSRQGLLVIGGELSMREDAQAVFVLTAEGRAQGVALPDLAAAHDWHSSRDMAWNPFEETLSKPKAVCATCGQAVPV